MKLNMQQIKRYKLTLTTIGPVHVGCGEKTTAQDYIIINGGNTAFFPDMGDLYSALPEEKRELFLKHLQSPKSVSNDNRNGSHDQRLSEWLVENGVKEVPENVRSNKVTDISSLNTTSPASKNQDRRNKSAPQSIGFRNANTSGKCNIESHKMQGIFLDRTTCPKCIALQTEASSNSDTNEKRDSNSLSSLEQRDYSRNLDWKISKVELKQLSDVNEFIRDTLTGKPYIPGSSLKGALITIIKGSEFIEQKWNKERQKGELNFHPSNLRVSDSKLVDSKNLIICSKWDEVATSGNYQSLPIEAVNPHELTSLKRQCLKPGTKIELEIQVLENHDFITILKSSAHNWYSRYKKQYLDKFSQNLAHSENEDIIYIGQGVGFLAKTDYIADSNNSDDLFNQIQRILNDPNRPKGSYINQDAIKSRDHKNMHDSFDECSCPKQHPHRCGAVCKRNKLPRGHKKFSTTKLVDDLRDFGVCPRCLKLAKIGNQFYEMGKCKFKIEEIYEEIYKEDTI